jgi:sugar lactone lactonase YvrE
MCGPSLLVPPADLEVGDTAGLGTCATPQPTHVVNSPATNRRHRLAGSPILLPALALLTWSAAQAQTVYIGNSLQAPSGAPDGFPPLVILGEYNPAGPSATSPTLLPTGTVQDVKFYGQDYNFTLYALAYVASGPNNEQTFRVVASASFAGTAPTPGIQTLPVSQFCVNAGELLAFSGAGPYYPQNPNDALNSDATYEDSANPGSLIAAPPAGPGTEFIVGLNPDPSANYEYIPDEFGNQGRTYALGVDVATNSKCENCITIGCPANITQTTSSNSLPVFYSVNAWDSCANFTLVSEPPSGSTFPLGTTIVTNTAFDSLGNTNTCRFTVTVLRLQPTNSLGASARWEGPAAGSDSVLLAVVPATAAWTASADAAWLHLDSANQSGVGSENVVFTCDANPGLTRNGTLTIAGQTLTVTQAGSTYIAAPIGLTTLVSSDLNAPWAVAVDRAGNVYIADHGNSAIRKWTAANNTLTTLVSSGLSGPQGVAVDGLGNVYIADSGHNAVKEWVAASGAVTALFSNVVRNPYGLAVDGAGNVYVADWGDDAVKEWTVANSNVVALVSAGLNGPTSLALDAAGNLYISDYFNQLVREWTPVNGKLAPLFSPLSGGGASGVAVDGAGNLYVADGGNFTIEEWTAASDSLATLVSWGLSIPQDVAVDALGNVYIADCGNNAVEELPYAFVDPTDKLESLAAGSDVLPVVLPSAANLRGPFAPTSDQLWLTITGVTNGIVSFAFTATTTPRMAHITLLGQPISITQVLPPCPTLFGARMLAKGVFQAAFSNSDGAATFTVLYSTNPALPIAQWAVLGPATNVAPGLFQFTDTQATDSQRFYSVRSQ